jgi:hypothetical protein
MAWLRAFALFALLVAVPFLVEELLGKHPRLPIGPIRVSDSFWQTLLSYSSFGIVVALFVGFLVVLLLFLPQTYEISEWLTLAEREMNGLLRGWGGGLAGDARKNMVKERADWLSMLPDSDPAALVDVYKEFFNLNQNELASGGPQATPMGRARYNAFLLREIYEGNVRSAQTKIFSDVKNGVKPFIVPGIRQILGYDKFDEKTGFQSGAGVDWFPLMMTVKLYHYPRNILMVKPGGVVVENWAVLNELNQQLKPKPA